ncbi:hypothetical protein NL676_014618 [Syzygium grande]|nr:hypothetical protein NL676_014618 [Syzygium grande]
MVERKVPVIDTREYPGPSHKLGEACEAWGCFRIVNHKIPLKLMSEMKAVVKSLLDLPSEIKRRNADVITGVGIWHPARSILCMRLETIESYAQATHKLVVDIAAKLAQTVELSGEPFEEWTCLLRMNKDNFTPETLGSSGVQVHTDSRLLTILQDDDNASGLDVMDSSGSFVALCPWPGTFLVNLGDLATCASDKCQSSLAVWKNTNFSQAMKMQPSFVPNDLSDICLLIFIIGRQIWSDGRWRNVKHCVPCKEATTPTQVSTATFILGPKQGVVKAPPELIDPKHLRLYGPVVYEDFRNPRIPKNLQAGEALTVMCAQF